MWFVCFACETLTESISEWIEFGVNPPSFFNGVLFKAYTVWGNAETQSWFNVPLKSL